MPVQTESSLSGPYIPNGVTTAFPFDFKATAANEVVAIDQDGETISTALYSVTLDGDEGGTLTFSTAPQLSSYSAIFVASDPALTQPSDFDNAGPSFNPAALTRALDRAAARDLKQQRQIDSSLKLSFGETAPILPPAAQRVSTGGQPRIMGFDRVTGELSVLEGGDFRGATGLAANTFDNLAAFKAAPTSQFKVANLSGVTGVTDGQFFFETENAPYAADNINVIKADDTALSTGAWVRQLADKIAVPVEGTAQDALNQRGYTVPLFADIATAKVPAIVNIIQTCGYTTRGKGGALYRRDGTAEHGVRGAYWRDRAISLGLSAAVVDASLLNTEGRFRKKSADGAAWTLVEDQAVNDFMFGSVRDASYNFAAAWNARWTGTDDTDAVQAMLDWGYYFGGRNVVHPATGFALITRTLHIGYGIGFGTLHVSGDGATYLNLPGASSFVRNFCGQPFINVQAARECTIKGFGTFSTQFQWLQGGFFAEPSGAPFMDDTNPNNWHDPATETALGRSPDARYAPDAAITIDAYSGTRPSGSYDDVAYPAWTGITTQWGKPTSSSVEISEVMFAGETNVCVIHPSGSDGNGDFVTLEHIGVNRCKRILSVGQTQSRATKIGYVKGGSVFEVVSNRAHGKQTGQFSSEFTDVSISGCIRLYDITGTSQTAPITFTHCYIEAGYAIGYSQGATSVEGSIVLDQCKMSFDLQGANGRPIAPARMAGRREDAGISNETLVIRGGKFSRITGFMNLNTRLVIEGMAYFDNSYTGAEAGTIAPYMACASNATAGGVVPGWRAGQPMGGRYEQKFHLRSLDSGASFGQAELTPSWMTSNREHCIPVLATSYMHRDGGVTEGINRPRQMREWDRSSITHTAFDYLSTHIEWRFTRSWAQWEGERINGAVGDIWICNITGMTWVVKSVTWGAPSSFVLRSLNNTKLVAGAHAFVEAFNPTVGGLHGFNCRHYAPRLPLFGTLTSGANTLAPFGDDEGVPPYISPTLANRSILPGDRAFIFPKVDNYMNESATILNHNGTDWTLGGNASKTGRRQFPLLIRTVANG